MHSCIHTYIEIFWASALVVIIPDCTVSSILAGLWETVINFFAMATKKSLPTSAFIIIQQILYKCDVHVLMIDNFVFSILVSMLTVQVASLRQGPEAHSSISMSQFFPLHPGRQPHV